MKRSFILAALVALSSLAASAVSVSASTYNLPADELEICRILELAHESSCAEHELTMARQYAAAEAEQAVA